MAEFATVGRFATDDLDEAVRETSRLLAPHQLVLSGDRSRFSATVNKASLGDVVLYQLAYDVGGVFHCPPQSGFVAVVLNGESGLTLTFADTGPVLVPAGACAAIPAGSSVDIGFNDGATLSLLTATVGALRAGLSRIAPHLPIDGLAFEQVVRSGASAATFGGLASLIRRTAERYEAPSTMPPTVVNALRDQSVSTFLLDLPHTESSALLRLTDPVPSRTLRRALQFIDDHANTPCSVTAMAATLDVSVRNLEKSFRKELGCTPRKYLQRVRLQRAHDELRRARPGDGTTVTEIAMRCGFGHVGRFAMLYRRVYGVAPSLELRGRSGTPPENIGSSCVGTVLDGLAS